MSVQRGEVVLVDWPFNDRKGSKVRPALVVQADAMNQRITDTIIASISGSLHRVSATQLVIDISTPDGKRTGLRVNSTVQCENLFTIDQGDILRTIGTLSAALSQKVDGCLKAALQLP